MVLNIISPVFIPLVMATDIPEQTKNTLSGLLVVGIPQFLSLTAVAVMGKEGFKALQSKIFGFVKDKIGLDQVSKSRYQIGLAMFFAPVFFGWIHPYFPGLLPGWDSHRIAYAIVGDVLFLSSLIVLGSDFWDKIKALFIYDSTVLFEQK